MKKTLIIFIACINAALATDAKTHYEIQLASLKEIDTHLLL